MINIPKYQLFTINVGYYIPSAELLLRGAASGHLLKFESTGDQVLIATRRFGSFTFIGCSWAGFSNFFDVRRQTLPRDALQFHRSPSTIEYNSTEM